MRKEFSLRSINRIQDNGNICLTSLLKTKGINDKYCTCPKNSEIPIKSNDDKQIYLSTYIYGFANKEVTTFFKFEKKVKPSIIIFNSFLRYKHYCDFSCEYFSDEKIDVLQNLC